ncbi:MAG: hypothetical protein DMF78_02450 [Acidobacteria bacterium]|nr:MAG: hypothetical protein DMF78_02450 [Acidobacteriota bacterium]
MPTLPGVPRPARGRALLEDVGGGRSSPLPLAPARPRRSAGASGLPEMRPALAHSAPGAEFEAYLRRRRREGQPAVLDLGCGAHKTEGAFGIDSVSLPGVDLVHDLEARPYPLPDDCADQVVLNHVVEHFAETLPLMEEVWRIARPGGRVLIRTPH